MAWMVVPTPIINIPVICEHSPYLSVFSTNFPSKVTSYITLHLFHIVLGTRLVLWYLENKMYGVFLHQIRLYTVKMVQLIYQNIYYFISIVLFGGLLGCVAVVSVHGYLHLAGIDCLKSCNYVLQCLVSVETSISKHVSFLCLMLSFLHVMILS